jgi:predicted RNase H-like HicB family nuclease
MIFWGIMSRYVVIVEDSEGGRYDAWCPDLPGCVAFGDTYEECVSKMRETIAMHLRELKVQEASDAPMPPRVVVPPHVV